MQTFMPLPHYRTSASVLDNARLGKQLVECQQILQALCLDEGYARRHISLPGMWRGHEGSLVYYAIACHEEWQDRGRKPHASMARIYEIYSRFERAGKDNAQIPWWMGVPELHSQYRANLLRKDPSWYGQFGWTESPAEGYRYPVAEQPGVWR